MSHFGSSLSDSDGGSYRSDAATVVALTEATAAIQSSTGAITIYRRHNKPALGPAGDSALRRDGRADLIESSNLGHCRCEDVLSAMTTSR